MSDLFDAEASEAAKQEGIKRVTRHANPAWLAAMFEYTIQTAQAQRYFTSDDVFLRARCMGMTLRTRDNRAFGSVVIKAAKMGVCRKAHFPPENSKRRTLHRGLLLVWESLIIDIDAALLWLIEFTDRIVNENSRH